MRVYHGKEANLLHQAIIQQDRLDNSIETNQKRRLRNALKYGLRKRVRSAITDRTGRLSVWYTHKLDKLMAYGMSDMSLVSERQKQIADAYLFDGATQRHLALVFAVSERQVRRDIDHVLNIVIDTAPSSLIRMLDFSVARYIVHSCSNCGSTLEWDADGAHEDGEGEYCCFQCARRYTFDLKPVGDVLMSLSP